MTKRQNTAAYFLQHPKKLIYYVCNNNPQGVMELLNDQYPDYCPLDGVDTEDEVCSIAMAVATDEGIEAFAPMLANSVAHRNRPNHPANIYNYQA